MDEIQTSREYLGQAQANSPIGEEGTRMGGINVDLALRFIGQNGTPPGHDVRCFSLGNSARVGF